VVGEQRARRPNRRAGTRWVVRARKEVREGHKCPVCAASRRPQSNAIVAAADRHHHRHPVPVIPSGYGHRQRPPRLRWPRRGARPVTHASSPRSTCSASKRLVIEAPWLGVCTHRASIQTPFELVSDLFLRAFEPRLPRRPPSEPCRPILPPMRRRHDEAGVGSLSPRPECPWSRAHGHAAGSRAAADCQSADSQSADSQSADSQDPAGCGAPAARRASAPPGSHQSG
jgi:hypothetical protein